MEDTQNETAKMDVEAKASNCIGGDVRQSVCQRERRSQTHDRGNTCGVKKSEDEWF